MDTIVFFFSVLPVGEAFLLPNTELMNATRMSARIIINYCSRRLTQMDIRNSNGKKHIVNAKVLCLNNEMSVQVYYHRYQYI